jgi:hypothetical protein
MDRQLAGDALKDKATVKQIGEIQGETAPQGPQIEDTQHPAHPGVHLQQAALADLHLDLALQSGPVQVGGTAGPGQPGQNPAGGLFQVAGVV